MNFDYLNANIYKSTEYAYAKNLSLILTAALVLLVLEIAKSVFDLSNTFSIAEVFLDILIAYAFHTTILLGVSSDKWREHFKMRKGDNQFKPFMWRSIAFIGMMFGVMIILALISISLASVLGGDSKKIFVGLFLLSLLVVGLPIYGLLFAIYGTVLPAAVSGDDASFSTAFHRSKGLYLFTFSRLLIGPTIFLTGLAVLTVALASMGVPVSAYTADGKLSVIGMGVSFLFYAFKLFSVGLTATVLCKTYLKSVEIAEQST